MVGFRLVWALALAMVAYGDVVDGGCRGTVRLLGRPADEAGSGGPTVATVDAWLEALRRWRQRSGGGRSAGSGDDGPASVSRHP